MDILGITKSRIPKNCIHVHLIIEMSFKISLGTREPNMFRDGKTKKPYIFNKVRVSRYFEDCWFFYY